MAVGVAAAFIPGFAEPHISQWDRLADVGPTYFAEVCVAASLVFFPFGLVLFIRDLRSYMKHRHDS